MASRFYRVGDVKFGLRTNSDRFTEWLDDALGSYRIEEEEELALAPYFSVFLAEEGKPGKRFHVIYIQTRVLVRSLKLETIARALVSQFELFLLPDRDDAIYGEMTMLASDGRNALVPPVMLPLLETFSQREIARVGLVLPYTTTVAIEPDSGDLVPMPRLLDVPEEAFEQFRRSDPAQAEPRIVVERPVGVDAVVSFGQLPDPLGPVSKAEALYRAASHTLNLPKVGTAVGLEGLRRTVERASCYEMGVQEWKRVPQGLAAILRP